jgi:tight adherence protein C
MSTLIGLMFSVAVTMLLAGVRRIRTPGLEAHLAPFGETRGDPRPRTRYERLVRPLALRLADGFGLLRGLSDPAQLSQQLDDAGNPRGITAHEFYGVQVYALLAGLLIGVVWMLLELPLAPFVVVLLPIGGFYYPRLWLRGRVRRRQHLITIALPDLLDMLAVCVSAGMGFDVALRLLAERGAGPLYEELARLLRELRIGEPREQAFRHMAARNSSEALRSFVDALLQAEELGAPIAATLERQAEDMRVSRRYRARAQASKAATKISLVIVVLVVPTVMCMIMGGIVLSISQSMRSFLTLQP